MTEDEKLICDMNDLRDTFDADCDYDLGQLIRRAVERIEAQARPLTLDECRDVLNANEYVSSGSWDDAKPWVVVESSVFGQVLVLGTKWLTLFEARCLARGFLAQGGAA